MELLFKKFIVFEAIVNGIVFLISVSDSSSLAYKNATDILILIKFFKIYFIDYAITVVPFSLLYSPLPFTPPPTYITHL